MLNRRPQKVGRAYEAIWNREADESFLRTYTRNQSDLLARALAPSDARILVDWAMRYGSPSIAERIGAPTFVKRDGVPLLDDHQPVLQIGLPAAVLIDFDSPYWHTLEDTPDKCSPESLESVGRVLVEYLNGLE